MRTENPGSMLRTCHDTTNMMTMEPIIWNRYRTSMEMLTVTAFWITCTCTVRRQERADLGQPPTLSIHASRATAAACLRVRGQATGQLARSRLVKERHLLHDHGVEDARAQLRHDL